MTSLSFTGMKARSIIKKTIIYIILVIISIIWIFPFVYLLGQSFAKTYDASAFMPSEWVFDNYVTLFTSSTYPFWRWFFNTFLIALVTCILQTILVLMTSYALSRLRFKGRKAIMKMILVLGMFPGFLGMICTYFILDLIGLSGNIFGLS